MSGGYGSGRRGSGDGQEYDQQGYDQQGYEGQDYDPAYDDPAYRGRRRRPAGPQQPGAGPGGGAGQPGGYPGQGGRPGRGQGQGYGPGYDQPDYDPRAYGQPQAPGRGYGSPQGRDQGYGPSGYEQPDPRGQRQPPDAGRYPRGGRPGQQGYGADPSWQQQGGYDQGDAYPGGGYPGRYGQGGDPGRDPGLLPGLGQGDPGGYPGYDNVEDRPRRRGRDGGRGGGGGGDDWDDGGDDRPRRSTMRRLAPWIALLVILTPLLVGGLYIYHIYENKYHPADYSGPGTGSVTVQVNSGDTAFSLGPKLQSLGVVASARAFELAAEQTTSTTGTTTGAAPGLEAGFYKLHSHMQASLAWAALLNPKNRVQLTVTIVEGKRASQIALILAKATSIPASQFQAVINNPSQLGLPSYAHGKVEGYLFPATYTIEPNETATQILKAMVARYNVEAQAINLSSAANAVHLSAQQVIIEASLAQAEGGSVSDYPKIARVISNRLKVGMHLQFDSTVLYGLGKYAVSATIAETRTPGPYNTYLNAGLPAGPICNPGNAAIQAVLHPASGNWLYFLTKPGGASEFSTTPLAGQ